MRVVRLAWHFGWRGGRRAWAYPLLAFVPFLLILTGITAANSITATAQDAADGLGGNYATFQLSDSSGAPVSDRASYDRAAATLAGVAPLVGVGLEGDLMVRSETSIAVVRSLEEDWAISYLTRGYRIVEGRFPAAAGEVVLAAPTAQALDAGVGDTLRWGYEQTPVRVVGVGLFRQAHQAAFLLAGPGTWWSEPRSPTELMSLVLRVDPVHGDRAAAALGQTPSDFTGLTSQGAPLPFYVRQTLLVAIPVILAAGAALGALVLIRFRRLGSDLAIASGLGLRDSQVRRLALLTHLGTVVPAIVLGCVLGVPLGNWLSPWVAGAADRDVVPHGIPVSALLWAMVTGVVGTSVIATLAGGAVVRELRAGAAARPSTDALQIRGPRWWHIGGVGLVGAALTAFGAVQEQTPDVASINSVRSLLLSVGVITILASVGMVLSVLLSKVLSRNGIALRFSSLHTARDSGKSTAIALVALVLLALPLSVLVNQASYARLSAVIYHPIMLPGQIRISPSENPLTDRQVQEIEEAAGAPVITLPTLADPDPGSGASQWDLVTASSAEPSRTVLMIDDPAVLTTVAGYVPTASDIATLKRGGVLVFGIDPASPARIQRPQDSGEAVTLPVEASRASGTVDAIVSYAFPAVVLRGSFETTPDVQPGVAFYRVLGGAGRVDVVRAVAAASGFAAFTISVDERFLPPRNVPAELTLWIAYPLGALLILVLTAGVLRERNRELKIMSALGARSATVRTSAIGLVVLPLLTGSLCGLAAGIIGGWISFLPTLSTTADAELVVPLLAAALGVVGALVLGGAMALGKARGIERQ
ncbi:FtsX-like permease family protein [Nakamurella sp. A5-74]|uniref:FtsX-like permease family protein n=1 Tax=Nakamurella sp. A5-74 TaxID=3158264 RepID=A0AAU8DMX7_9ACTN